MAVPAGTRFGSYEILTLVGAGGMGELYHARDTRLNRDVALKLLPADIAKDPVRRARFEREAQFISRLNHNQGPSRDARESGRAVQNCRMIYLQVR